MLLKIVKILLSELREMKKYDIERIIKWKGGWYPSSKCFNYKAEISILSQRFIRKLRLLIVR